MTVKVIKYLVILVIGFSIIPLKSIVTTAFGHNTHTEVASRPVPIREIKSDNPLDGRVVSWLKLGTKVTKTDQKGQTDHGDDWVIINVDFTSGTKKFWINEKYLCCEDKEKDSCAVVLR
ncbi:MAG: hypothetical protein F6J94_23675 [Moorea sp. SIO1F2]|uniref:hypothetical protein n=1 Tax=Moorena sp. SIO1F2 TaxID=2607819 RepID=UPI0013B92084|nr:hypothetical protein [Moorena sp. SIO1F2]NET84804.1 hypothetical protein [Moorena sp. SIO1F2]